MSQPKLHKYIKFPTRMRDSASQQLITFAISAYVHNGLLEKALRDKIKAARFEHERIRYRETLRGLEEESEDLERAIAVVNVARLKAVQAVEARAESQQCEGGATGVVENPLVGLVRGYLAGHSGAGAACACALCEQASAFLNAAAVVSGATSEGLRRDAELKRELVDLMQNGEDEE